MAEPDITLPRLDPRSLPGPETIQRKVIENGITILTRENFSSPSVVISGFLTAGALADGAQLAGRAYLTAAALLRGTKGRTFQQIYEMLESIGARLNFSANTHSISFQGKSLAEDLPTLFDLMRAALTEATFPKREIERLKAQHLTSLAIRQQDTSARAEMAFDEIVYRRHPYRIPPEGYRKTVKSLTAADLRSFYRQFLAPQGMVIAVVGAVKARRVFALVERALGDWQKSNASMMPVLPPVRALQRVVRKDVTLRGKQQCDIIMGAAGPSRNDEDYLAIALGNSVLGRFGLMGRLGDAVRERAGLAYYAYSSVSGGPGPGPWQMVAGVHPAQVDAAIALMREEIARFVEKGITLRELRENQAHFIGRLPLQLESNEGVAGGLAFLERYQLGLDYYQRFPALIAALTRKDVLRGAGRFLHPDRLAIAVAGPGEGKGSG